MLYLPNFDAKILAGNMVPKMQMGVEEVHGGNTLEIGILTPGCEMEVGWGEREAPLWNVLTNRRICAFAGVQVHFKGANTVKELLVVSKHKDNIIHKGEAI